MEEGDNNKITSDDTMEGNGKVDKQLVQWQREEYCTAQTKEADTAERVGGGKKRSLCEK